MIVVSFALVQNRKLTHIAMMNDNHKLNNDNVVGDEGRKHMDVMNQIFKEASSIIIIGRMVTGSDDISIHQPRHTQTHTHTHYPQTVCALGKLAVLSHPRLCFLPTLALC